MFLHGYGSKKESFHYQFGGLKERFTVVAVDFPAFGASEPPEGVWGVGEYAAWLKRFMLKAGLTRPHVVAHSFGARVSFRLLAEDNTLCDRLVIIGGAGLVKPRSADYLRRVKAYRRVRKLFPRFAERHFGSEEYRRLSPVQRESYKLIVNEDLKDCAARVGNKTLLLYGAEDTVTPYAEEGETFRSLIKNSELVKCEGGHFGFCDFADKYNERILKFLTG